MLVSFVVLLDMFEIFEPNFVFVKQPVLEIQLTVFISNQRKRILCDMPASRNSHGNGLTKKVYVYDIERDFKFSVVVRELGKIILSFVLSCLCFLDIPP